MNILATEKIQFGRKGINILMKKRLISITLAVILLLSVCPIAIFADNATYNQTLDIAAAKKDVSGPGYQWQNRYDILTLTNITIDTNDTYGLKIPENATIILKGKKRRI